MVNSTLSTFLTYILTFHILQNEYTANYCGGKENNTIYPDAYSKCSVQFYPSCIPQARDPLPV